MKNNKNVLSDIEFTTLIALIDKQASIECNASYDNRASSEAYMYIRSLMYKNRHLTKEELVELLRHHNYNVYGKDDDETGEYSGGIATFSNIRRHIEYYFSEEMHNS